MNKSCTKLPMMITFQYSVIDRSLLLSTSTLSLANKTHFRNSEKFLETYVCVRFQVSHNSVPILQHPKLPLARMIHIPRLMMTINLADRSSFSTVTYSCQKMWHCTPNCHLLVWPIYQAQCTVTKSKANPKILKRGPKKGTQSWIFSELFTKSKCVKIVKKTS